MQSTSILLGMANPGAIILPRGSEASTIWSTIYATDPIKMRYIFRIGSNAARWGTEHRLHPFPVARIITQIVAKLAQHAAHRVGEIVVATLRMIDHVLPGAMGMALQ